MNLRDTLARVFRMSGPKPRKSLVDAVQVVEKVERRARLYAKPGSVFRVSRHTGEAVRVGSTAAPYAQLAPKVDGVRMRWEKGRLVPRAQS